MFIPCILINVYYIPTYAQTSSAKKCILKLPRHVSLLWPYYLSRVDHVQVGPVGIATGYGLDGPGSNPGGDEIFRPSRPALGTTQPPVQWVQSLSRG